MSGSIDSQAVNIAVNGRFLSRRVTGVERYGQEVLRCLQGRMKGRLRMVRPRGDSRMSGHLWEQAVLPRRLRPGEVLLSPANTGPLAVANQVLVLHDLSALEHPEWYSPAFGLWYRLFLPALARRTRRLVVSSEHVRRKVERRFSLPAGRVAVAPGGVDLRRFHPGRRPPAGLPDEYVLFVGSLQPRKNLGVLLQAWELVHHRFPGAWLLLAGAHGPNFALVELPGGRERVRGLGYVPDDDLPGLYAGAAALALPSLDEGFGLPVLEAMACGAPVIAARAGALPELVGEAGLLFDPARPDELAGALARCLAEPDLRVCLARQGRERAQGFPWQRPAETIWEVLQSCR